jgi:hypothetical protein
MVLVRPLWVVLIIALVLMSPIVFDIATGWAGS